MPGKTVLITGASRGIGRETAKQFALAGDNIIINYFSNEESAVSLMGEISELTGRKSNMLVSCADVRRRDQIAEMFRKAEDVFGPVEILVNNAGIAQQKLFSDISENEWDNMFDINVKGVFNCTQAALPGMIRKKSGKIINISSIWGIAGASCETHYSASKAAVIGLTKALAKELGPSGIQVNCIAPGVIDTDMNSSLSDEIIEQLKDETPLSILGTPGDIAALVCFLASDKSDFITGQVISPNGGFLI